MKIKDPLAFLAKGKILEFAEFYFFKEDKSNNIFYTLTGQSLDLHIIVNLLNFYLFIKK